MLCIPKLIVIKGSGSSGLSKGRIYHNFMAKQSGESLEMQNHRAEIKRQTERRRGELFKEIERAERKRTDLTAVHGEPQTKLKQVEKEAGVTTSTRKR